MRPLGHRRRNPVAAGSWLRGLRGQMPDRCGWEGKAFTHSQLWSGRALGADRLERRMIVTHGQASFEKQQLLVSESGLGALYLPTYIP